VDEAAVVDAALRPLIDQYYRERRNTPDMASRDAYAWDALVQLARDCVTPTAGDAGQSTDSPDGTTATTDGTTKKGKTAKRSPRYLAIIRLDHSALVRGWTEDDEVCEIPGLGQIPVTRARELLGESSLRLVITKGIDVQNVTYLGRGVNAAQQVALWWSQPLCTNIACHRTHLQNDHRDPHARVQCTELPNMDPMCGHDHDLKTYQGWALVPGSGRRAFVPPDDPRHPNNSAAPPGGTDRPRENDPPPDQLFPDTS
jgi:hypothetical protein